ncbi:Putative Conserved membrane protein [Aspergillus calidoustus]|uniref:DSC E3 ubiquitin ligase complex subunit C n=1 Tax=Aspergillus calidoustus TaxID=454130 RepID=A0A0U5G0Q9_ASPCI|nr:Putative Conserved membrane protein [Aspergillus calidoustus]
MSSASSILSRDPRAMENDPLLIIVRFSASIPDLRLDIESPETTTSAGLKQAIRARLPSSLSSHRLRLIYAGRGLEDTTPLALSLKLPPPPTRFSRSTIDTLENHGDGDKTGKKDKGKLPVREPPRLYVHCSIGDIVLSAADLATEAAAASTLHEGQDSQTEAGNLRNAQRHDQSSTAPAPRGFDRLLSAGFTAAEVAALRSQFMAIQSVSRTPDTMPSGAELRELEDRWMDEGTSAMAAGAVGGAEGVVFTDDDGGFGTGSRGAIDDMLWGAVMGFFWPVGCAMWLRREEGVWSWRKGLAVFVGVVVNIAFGAMRIMN